jgi:hypothetical protein
MNFEERIKAIDNIPGILDFKFEDGSPVWLAIRFRIRFLYLETNSTGTAGQISKNVSKWAVAYKILKYAWNCWLRRPRNGEARPDILTIANYEDNVRCPNRMTTAYVNCPDFRTVEWLYSPVFIPFPKIKNTFSFDYFYINALISEKIKGFYKQKTQHNKFDGIIHILHKHLDDIIPAKSIEAIKFELLRTDVLSSHYRKMLRRKLEKLNPGMVVCSEGNNGDWRHNILFSLLRELQIPSAEVQHGTFNIGMKYGSELVLQDEFKKYKTDYIFTFGNYHSEQTNIPAQCIPIGHFPLEMELDRINAEPHNNDGILDILFVCEGLPPSSKNNEFINTTFAALSKLGQSFRLTVRLHHSETANDKYNPFFTFPGTRYSHFEQESIFGLLASADLIILHASTVAFESIYFKKNPLVFHDQTTAEYVPKDIGLWFKYHEELLKLLQDQGPSFSFNTELRKRYWAEGKVIENFKKFRNTHIINPTHN